MLVPPAYAVLDQQNTTASVQVNSVVDITLSNTPITFPASNPGASQVQANVGNGYPLTITVENTTNADVGIRVRGDANFISGAYSFAIGNLEYCNESVVGEALQMTSAYPGTNPFVNWDVTAPAGGGAVTLNMYNWVSIPTNQEAGNYQSNVYIRADETWS